jgi:hypothetical protein
MAEPPARRKPLGEPLTEDALLALADVTPEDLAAAEALWESGAPPRLRTLLAAEPAEEGT